MTLLRLAPAPDPATTLIEPEPGRARLTTAPRPTPEQLRLFVDLPTAVPDPPGPTGIRRRNPRLQGEIGLSDAIAFFGRRGFTVSVPLADNQAYDLLVELDGLVCRVQVKTTTSARRVGVWKVQLATRGGNRSFHTQKAFDPDAVDILFVLADDGGRWVIPSVEIDARTSLLLYRRYDPYRVGSGAP